MAEIVIQPQPGQQTKAAKCAADILIYGGAAFGGKTWFQGYRASQYHRVKGYHAILLRRTHKMLKQSGGLWDQASELCRDQLGAEEAYPLLRWPAYKSKIEFSHLQHDKNAGDHKSAQYAYVGLDEGSDFTGKQFEYMRFRVRSMAGVRTQIGVTTNPDPDCYLREWVDWWIGSDGYPIPERDGRLRYFLRIKGELVWADTPDELYRYTADPRDVQSVAFIAAKATDNKLGLAADPSYMAKLRALPPVEQARFLGGNWDVREAAGDYFQRGWFPEYGSTELERALIGQTGSQWDIVDAIRFWDRAATPVKGDLVPSVSRPADFSALDASARDKEPDWSASVLMVRFRNGKRCIWDCAMYRDTPGAIEQAMVRHAIEDGKKVAVGYWQDPAQAGIDQAQRAAKLIERHARVWFTPQLKTKQEYAREPSRAAYRGEILQRGAADLRKLWSHLEAFDDPKKKRDGVDAFTGAELYFAENAPPAYGFEPVYDSRVRRTATPAETFLFAGPRRPDPAIDTGAYVNATAGFKSAL